MRSVAVSIAVHGVVVAWLVLGRRAHVRPVAVPTAVRTELEISPIADDPVIEVAFFDAAAPVARPAEVQPAATRRATSQVPAQVQVQVQVGAATTTATATGEGAHEIEAPIVADLQLHRVPELAAVLPTSVAPVAPAVAPAAPLANPVSPDSGELDPTATHEAFSLHVNADGTARLHDTRNFHSALKVPDLKAGRTDGLAALEERPELRPSTLAREDAPRPFEHPIGPVGVVVFKFDLTDWLMRSHGQDPYASAKLNQLDATRDARAELGARYRRSQLARAGTLMQQNLDTAWATLRDDTARKQAVFDLWSECDATDAAAATQLARAQILAFARAHQFSAAELAQLKP